MRGNRSLFLGVALAATLFASVDSGAAPIGLATNYGYDPVGAPTVTTSSLYQVDLGASTATLIGSTGFQNVTGLSFQPGSGTLYGVDHASDQLIIIDTTTGLGTAVGSLGVDVFDVGLAFDASGNLFLSDNGGVNDLFSVNVATGAATLIGSTGTQGVVGLTFDSTGTLLGLYDTPGDSLVTVNTTTAAATVIGGLGFSTNAGGIDFDANGTLYGAFGFVNPGLTTINPNTGAAAVPTDVGLDFAGLAIRAPVIPEPGSVSLFAASLLVVSTVLRRRRV